jgi:hypothetical protein
MGVFEVLMGVFALFASLVAGGGIMGVIVILIPDLIFRKGKSESELTKKKQSKIGNAFEMVVVVCLIPVGMIIGAGIGENLFVFLTGGL